jgi:hypothetical protein
MSRNVAMGKAAVAGDNGVVLNFDNCSPEAIDQVLKAFSKREEQPKRARLAGPREVRVKLSPEATLVVKCPAGMKVREFKLMLGFCVKEPLNLSSGGKKLEDEDLVPDHLINN